jgi:hypothetical protein
MFKHMTAHDRVKLIPQFLQFIQGQPAEPMSVGGEQLSGDRQEFLRYVNPEVIEIKLSLADHFKHDPVTTANIKNG